MIVEDLARSLGNPGKFQVLLYVMLCMVYVFVPWNHLGMAFMAAETKHHCKVKNQTLIAQLVPVIVKDGKEQWDGCYLYAGHNTTKKVRCPDGWTYYLPDREWTVLAEWNLVCDDAYKASLATTMYFVGVMLGALVFGTLSDRFGRRPVFLFTVFSPSVVALLLFFFRNYVAFVILRFILGFLLEGLQVASYMFVVEVVSVQFRTFAGIFTSVFWAIGVMSLALISYLIQDWRYIQLFSCLVGLFMIGMICFLPESFRWLLIKQRVNDAKRVIQRIASFNKLPFPRDVFDNIEKNVTNEADVSKLAKHYTIVDIFRLTALRKRSIILSWAWFSPAFGYYGLALNVSSLAGNKYLNFFISGVCELTVSVLTAFALQRFGRRKPLFLYAVIGGITCIAAGVLSDKPDYSQKLVTTLALCGRILISGVYAIMYIFTAELYPTEIRNVGFGSGVFWARIGSILAPQVLLLGKYSANSVPFIIFGGSVLLTGALGLLLPETSNVRLAETLGEAGNFVPMARDTAAAKTDGDELTAVRLIEKS